MSIVGAFDVHRRQLTFDFLDTVTGEVKRGRVVALRFFFRRAARPSSRISPATVFSLTRHPASLRSAVIRGEPYLPSCSRNRRSTSALSRSRRAVRGPGPALFHL